MEKNQLEEAAYLLSNIGASLMVVTGLSGIIGIRYILMSTKGNLLLSFLTILAGVVILAIQFNKLPLIYQVPMRVKFNRGILYIILGIVTIKAGLGSIFVFIAGIFYIWNKLEKALK